MGWGGGGGGGEVEGLLSGLINRKTVQMFRGCTEKNFSTTVMWFECVFTT